MLGDVQNKRCVRERWHHWMSSGQGSFQKTLGLSWRWTWIRRCHPPVLKHGHTYTHSPVALTPGLQCGKRGDSVQKSSPHLMETPQEMCPAAAAVSPMWMLVICIKNPPALGCLDGIDLSHGLHLWLQERLSCFQSLRKCLSPTHNLESAPLTLRATVQPQGQSLKPWITA